MLDASGLIHIQENLFLVAEDELDQLRFFEFSRDSGTFHHTGRLLDFGAQESDFESLARTPGHDTFYCIGSHSADYSRALLRFRLRDLQPVDVEQLEFDATRLVAGHVNIEGLSVYRDSLFIGLRSPRLAGRAAALIFNPASGAQLLTSLDLEQRVFRDLACIDPGNYLILAGPERGRDYPHRPARVFWWNGELLCPELQPLAIDLAGFRAESICTRGNADGSIDILLGSDESKVRQARRFRMLHACTTNLDELLAQGAGLTELAVDTGGP